MNGHSAQRPLSAAQWAAIARAAARMRQVRQDGLHGCYGDAQLLASAQSHARGQLAQVLQGALLQGAVERGELLEAAQAGDPSVDAGELAELVERLQRRDELLADLLGPWGPRDEV